MTGRRSRLALAFVSGASASLVFAPFHFLPAGFLAFALLHWLLDRCTRTDQAFWTGWFFAWGHFIAGLYWIASAFLVEPEKFAWMIPIPVLGLPALLAIFPAVATALAWRIAPTAPARVFALAGTWTLMEMARGTVLTGFPWNLIGYAWGLDTLTMQGAAWVGVYGMSLLALLLFGAPAALFHGRPGRTAGIIALALPLLVGLVAAFPTDTAQQDNGKVTVRIVQANIPQREKWRRDLIESNFDRLAGMSRTGAENVDIVIWPETAATYLLAQRPDKLAVLGDIAARTGSGLLITGAPHAEPVDGRQRFFNSVLAIDGAARVAGIAHKHHLVPFGEYLPLRPVLQSIGLDKLAPGRGDFASGAPEQTLSLPGAPAAAVLVCYEAIFPSLSNRANRPGWILNLTNDGWFGELTGPDQHFAMTRFRAVEQGLPLVRAAGTGISGVVSHTGHVIDRIPLNTSGVLDVEVALKGAETFYARAGNLPALAAALLLSVALGFRKFREQ